MSYRLTHSRQLRRGGLLGMAMLFFVMVTVAGAAILSMSTIQRIKTVRNGIDVRLMIAAEAGIESVRGRFTVIPIIQEDWSWLAQEPGWTNVGNLTINGIQVDVIAQGVGGPSVPTARVRSTATSGVKSRSVEYRIKVATFSDYAVFNAGGGTNTLGQDYKGVGNMYYGGNLDIPNTGAQIFGKSTIVGSVLQGYTGPTGTNGATGQSWGYHFPMDPPAEFEPAIPLPTWASPWAALETVADSVGHLYGENTLAIQLLGTQYRRYYVQRIGTGTGAGTVPSGTNWLDLTDGDLRFGQSSTDNAQYILTSEVLDIPDEGVIYVKNGTPFTAGASTPDVAATCPPGASNGWTQATNWTSTNGTGSTSVSWPQRSTGTGDYANVRNYGMPGAPYAKVLLLWGTLDDRRVSISCDHKIILADTIAYQSLLDNPEYRNFHGDGSSGKQSDGALGFKEMLGVMSQEDCALAPTWWSPRPSSQMTSDVAGELVPGHTPTDAYCMDGVFFSLYDTRPHRFIDGQSWGEFWGHGGLIAGGSYAAGMGNHFARRNYDWDYRLAETTPPYFLRAYNASAVFLSGTWRTWES